MIRIEFWNGQMSKKQKYEFYKGYVTTKHNPCLWSNTLAEDKPWRNVYKKALKYLKKWKLNEINDTELLHSLRYVAYGFNDNGEDKRTFNDVDVIWPGNLTINHKPKLIVKEHENEYTLYFNFITDNNDDCCSTDNKWKVNIVNKIDFYWPID